MLADRVTNLARSKFGELTRCEELLLADSQTGNFVYGDSNRSKVDPTKSGTWLKDREIRAEVIAWLCTDRRAASRVHFRGIQAHGVKVVGALDLNFAKVPFPLQFAFCAFNAPVLLVQSHLAGLVLTGCQFPLLNSEFATIAESVFIERASAASIRLGGAKIGGDLNCNGSALGAPPPVLFMFGGQALFADRINVRGNVLLSEGFRATGRVSFIGAKIEGDLGCVGAALSTPDGTSLDGDSSVVSGSVYLRAAKISGAVRWVGSLIRGDLDCNGAAIQNPKGKALLAERSKIEGSVLLAENFCADGEVSLLAATVGGELSCHGGRFVNPGGRALVADGIKVGSKLFLSNGFQSQGEVRCVGASVGGQLGCDGGTFSNPKGIALAADGVTVAGGVFLRDNFSTDGEVRLVGSTLSQLQVSQARFEPGGGLNLGNAKVAGILVWKDLGPHTPAWLNLGHATAQAIADDEQSWPKIGLLFLDGFEYGRIAEGPTDAGKRLEWVERQRAGFKPHPYKQLAKVLREAGDEAGCRRVLITMENSRRKLGNLTRSQWVSSWLLRLTIGYGYAPFGALRYILFFVLLGALLFSWGHSAGVLTPAGADTPEQSKPFSPLVYSLETFLPLVDLHQQKYWLPDPNREPQQAVATLWPLLSWRFYFTPRFGEYLRIYLWIHILAGWFFTSMFVAGITGLVRRD